MRPHKNMFLSGQPMICQLKSLGRNLHSDPKSPLLDSSLPLPAWIHCEWNPEGQHPLGLSGWKPKPKDDIEEKSREPESLKTLLNRCTSIELYTSRFLAIEKNQFLYRPCGYLFCLLNSLLTYTINFLVDNKGLCSFAKRKT